MTTLKSARHVVVGDRIEVTKGGEQTWRTVVAVQNAGRYVQLTFSDTKSASCAPDLVLTVEVAR